MRRLGIERVGRERKRAGAGEPGAGRRACTDVGEPGDAFSGELGGRVDP